MTFRSLVILAIFTLSVLSGCGKHHRDDGHPGTEGAVERAQERVSALIAPTLKDPGKAQQGQAILEGIVAEVKQSRQQNREFHQQLYELNANYDAQPEDFLSILDTMNGRRMQSASKILRLRFDLTELMTREEWKTFTDGMAEMRRGYRNR